MDNIKYIIPLLSILAALFLNKFLNFSNLFSFIPDNYKMEVNVLFYNTTFNFFIDKLINNYKTIIRVIAYKRGEEENINSIPEITLNSSGVTEIKLKFYIEGKNVETLKKFNLILTLPNWIQTQSNVTQRPDKSYEYNIGKLLEIDNISAEIKDYKQVVSLPLIGFSNGNEKDFKVIMDLEKKIFLKFLCKFERNSFVVKIA